MATALSLVESDESVLLYTILEHEGKPINVYLTSTRFIIEPNLSSKTHDTNLDVRITPGE